MKEEKKMKIKRTLAGFISLALIVVNLSLGFTFAEDPTPTKPYTTVYSIMKK
jgi:hypothetical protein